MEKPAFTKTLQATLSGILQESEYRLDLPEDDNQEQALSFVRGLLNEVKENGVDSQSYVRNDVQELISHLEGNELLSGLEYINSKLYGSKKVTMGT